MMWIHNTHSRRTAESLPATPIRPFRLIDLHSHLLAGVDDGARTLEEALDMAGAMAADGVELVAVTPHVRDDWPTLPETMEARLDELRTAVANVRIPLDILPGGEIALDRLPRLSSEERARFGLGGNPSLLLLEFPYYGWPLQLADTVFRLRLDGITPVIAHPERSAEVQEAPQRLEPLVRAGAVVQLTAASVDGRLGKVPRETSRRLLELRLAHLIASDAHSPAIREAGLSAAAQSVGDEALGRWLTSDVPQALLSGEPLPERPESRRWMRRRRR
jgi:protein-tyrosine phosphatase